MMGHAMVDERSDIKFLNLFVSSPFETRQYIYVICRPGRARIGKNCVRGLEYGPRPQAEGRTLDRGHSFSQYGPT